MSSDPPGRYQSRLFNFLHRQSLRLTDRWDRAVRHLKVAAVWGAQILVYPVYLLVQASLSAGRQFSASAQAGWPQLNKSTPQEPQETPPTVDTPIQRVLGEVDSLKLQIERLKVRRLLAQQGIALVERLDLPSNLPGSGLQLASPSNPQPSNFEPSTQTHLHQTSSESSEAHLVIQGVACLLETRSLVLVTIQNTILDILTPQQQQKLSSTISWEMADLLRHRRIAQALDKKVTLRLVTLDQPRVFLPVRLFWQVMAWVQNSPVAIAANLFQESTLVYHPELNASRLNVKRSHLRPSTPEPEQGTLAFLDITIAELESRQLVPKAQGVIVFSQRMKRAWRDRTHKRLQPLQTQFTTPGNPDSSSEVSQSNTFGLQALIYAAIDYFFGKRNSNLPETDYQEQSTLLPNSKGKTPQLSGRHSTVQPPAALPPDLNLADTSEPDPWLTWSDLFGSPDASGKAQSSKVQIPNRQSQTQLPKAINSKIPVRPGNPILSFIKRFLGFKQPPGKLSSPSVEESMSERSESVVEISKYQESREAQPVQIQGNHKANASKKLKTPASAAVSAPKTKVLPAKTVTTAITTHSSDTNLEPAPDWIEISATPIGYVKHPLEQLLGYVDLAMLWLEEVAVKIWRWVQHLSRRG